VGNIEAVSGLASLICALPIGYLADTIGRSVVIRAGGILLFVTAILQISILQYTVDIDVTNPDDDQKDTIALWVSY
jgi:MFS family permease